MSALDRVLTRFPKPKKVGREWLVPCPAHADADPSLALAQGDVGVVFTCRAGCDREAVVAALGRMGIEKSDLFDAPTADRRRAKSASVQVGEWIYRLDGADHHRAVRLEPGSGGRSKDFRVYRADGKGGWTPGLEDTVRVPYRRDEVIAADVTEPVIWVEGEQKADAFVGMGFVATTTMGGRGQVQQQVTMPGFLEPFRGRHVVLCPDNDKAGEEYATLVASALAEVATSVKVLRLPGLPEKGDVVDWLAAAGTAEVMRRLVASAQPYTVAPAPRWKTPGEQARELGSGGAPVPTGLATLDRTTRGGFRPGVVVIGGAPGAGKTTLLTQLAWAWAQAGHVVSVLAADEEARGLLIRVGQAMGLERQALEDGDPVARGRLADRLDAHPALSMLDGNELSVEDVVEDLVARAGGRPAFLLIDSVQTVRAEGTVDADGPRARVDAVMASLKAAARRGLTVVATCELNRGSYRSSRPEDRTEDLAAFKESGGIEYAANLALLMRNVKGENDLVDVATAKNRWGAKEPLRLRLSFSTATFGEVAVPVQGMAVEYNSEAQHEVDVEAARQALRDHPGVPGNQKLISYLRGLSKARQRAAVATLWAQGEVENRGTNARPRLHLAAVAPKSPGDRGDFVGGELARVAPKSPRSPGEFGGTNSPNSPHPYRGASYGASSVAGLGDHRVPGEFAPNGVAAQKPPEATNEDTCWDADVVSSRVLIDCNRLIRKWQGDDFEPLESALKEVLDNISAQRAELAQTDVAGQKVVI